MRTKTAIKLASSLCALAASAAALAPAPAGARAPSRAGASGRTRPELSRAHSGAHWACPSGRCDAIVLAHPRLTAAGWRSAGQAGALLEGSGELGGLDPSDLRSAYDIPTTLQSPQTIAVIDAYGYPEAEADLAAYRERYNLLACTRANGCFRKVNAAGEEGSYPPTEPEWDEEAALDVDMVSAACPQCHILMVETGSESTAALSAGDDTAAALGASEISNSWGEAERLCGSACNGYAADFEHPGVLITASAGDEGYESIYSSASHTPVSPEFPADLPDVLAVGGTALYRDSSADRGWREEVWNEPAEGLGSGSGCSAYLELAKPAWQSDAGCAYRTDNDVAAVAAPETPLSVRFDGAWELDGGTSASAPLLAGIAAHASAYARSLGPEAFYEDPAALNDVTEGFNYLPGPSPCAPAEYLCNAEIGYDGPSGLGTPHGAPAPKNPPPQIADVEGAALTAVSAVLRAKVDPEGERAECRFEYGTSTAYGRAAQCSPAPGSGLEPVSLQASLAQLKPGTGYDYRLTVKTAAGTTRSSNGTFTTPRAPAVATAAASELTSSSATLHGTVDPEGLAISACAFEYGTSASYGTRVACASTPSGTSPVPVSAALSGLKPGKLYDFRLLATSSAGTTKSANATFKTP